MKQSGIEMGMTSYRQECGDDEMKYRLGDIAPIQQGVVSESENYWLLNLDMIESNTGKIIDYLYVGAEEIGLSTIMFDEHNVLYSKLRPYLNKVVLPRKEGYATSEMLPLRPNIEIITREYLTYFLRSKSFVEYINEKTSGAKMPRANTSDLKAVEITCPSIEEQKKITEQLDRIVAIVDKRNQELYELDNLIKSRFVELFEKEEYKKVTVSSVLNTGFWLMPATPEFIVDGEVPYITSKNIKNRTIDFDNVKYISREAYKSISANRPTQKGDIVISMIGTLGQTAVIQDDREFYGQNLYLLRLNNSIVNTTYFCEFFNSDTAQHELQGKRNQSSQAYLKANHVEDLILPLPPIELQNQFAVFVEQTDKSKFEVQKSLDETQKLMDSLMQQYFG